MPGDIPAPPRRVEVLAFIVERISRSGISPSYDEIGRAMHPRIGDTRVRQLVDQLVALRVIDRDAGAKRGIRIRDLARCRAMIESALGVHGWYHAGPLGPLVPPPPCANAQLHMMPPFEHLPDV